MKNLFLLAAVLSLGACAMFGGDEKVPEPKPRGVFHPGPYQDPGTGKFCSAPGGFCDGDKKCHSSADKCPAAI